MSDNFTRLRLSTQLQTIRDAGGTADEQAWARQFCGIIEQQPGISLTDAEAQAWQNVIVKNMEGSERCE